MSASTVRSAGLGFIVWRIGFGVFFILLGIWLLARGQHWVGYAFVVLGAVSVAVGVFKLGRRSSD